MPPKKSSQILTTSQRSTRHATSSDDDDDDDNDHSMAGEDETTFKQMVCASVQYILIHSSKAQVIKRLDWTNTVLRGMTADARKAFPDVHRQVVKVLDQTFGYKLVLDEKHDGKHTRTSFTPHFSYLLFSPGYILVNGLKHGPLEQRPLTNSSHHSKYALLMIIVACLKQAGGEMTAVDFWAILAETFSIRNDESTRLTINQHKIFGDVQKLIKTDFVKEGYLIFDQAKDVTGDTPSQTVKLGLRAHQEFPDHALDEFINKVREYDIESDDGEGQEEEDEADAMDEDN